MCLEVVVCCGNTESGSLTKPQVEVRWELGWSPLEGCHGQHSYSAGSTGVRT